MSFHRATLVALATLFTVGTTSLAFAGCCEWGTPAPVFYGCGGCNRGLANIVYLPVAPAPITVNDCGGCAPVAYAEPVMPAPVATWSAGCGCGQAAPFYVTDQGPDYTGPGLMNPYRTWSQPTEAVDYPYVSGGYGYGHGYGYGYGRPYRHGPRYAYGAGSYGHPHSMRHGWRYPHYPLGVRD